MANAAHPSEMFIREIKIVTSGNHVSFNETVNDRLAEGWRMHTSPTHDPNTGFIVYLAKYDPAYLALVDNTVKIATEQLRYM